MSAAPRGDDGSAFTHGDAVCLDCREAYVHLGRALFAQLEHVRVLVDHDGDAANVALDRARAIEAELSAGDEA
jgi:hypothetical protein